MSRFMFSVYNQTDRMYRGKTIIGWRIYINVPRETLRLALVVLHTIFVAIIKLACQTIYLQLR
jgi:hypothetical protein